MSNELQGEWIPQGRIMKSQLRRTSGKKYAEIENDVVLLYSPDGAIYLGDPFPIQKEWKDLSDLTYFCVYVGDDQVEVIGSEREHDE